jgi:hypothetical protein
MDGMIINETAELNQDLSEAVRATAMLADLTISVWSAERNDAKIMERVRQDAGATGNVGRAIKNLLAGADNNLKATQAAFRAVRDSHIRLTLPWVSDPHALRLRGPRLLPNMLFERYTKEIQAKKRVATQALDAFVAGYDDDVATARANLAALADADYPTAEQVRSLFRVVVDFEPIPAGSSFKGLPPHFATKLGENLRLRQENMVKAAQTAMFEEVRERIAKLAEKMADQDATFKASTVENVQELLVLLPGWNVAGNDRVSEIADDIKSMIAGISPKQIRNEPPLRKDIASQAQQVLDKLSAWGL